MRNSSYTDDKTTQDVAQQNEVSAKHDSHRRGSIAVVGLGPGHEEELTPRALHAIEAAEFVVGYHTYMSLIKDLIADKKQVGTGMKQEIERCAKAVELASEGNSVVVVSSGDPGVYGMAGLVLELIGKLPEGKRPHAEIIPGLTAANTSAAILGAPLMHDYAVISLSDLLTPWELIKKRARMAAEGDFVIALYNPRSRGRATHLDEICEILLEVKDPTTPAGIVRKAGRNGMSFTITDLAHLAAQDVDMQSTVIIGNSRTRVENGRMITPRGYEL